MGPSLASLGEFGAAARVAARYLGRLPRQPALTQRFTGSVLRYVAAYNHHALYPRHLPVRLLHEVFPGIADEIVCLRHQFEDKALPYGEAFVLAALAAYLQPRAVFEIGTFTGATSVIIAEQAGPACRVWTLDMPPGQDALQLAGVTTDPPEADAARIGERFKGTALAGRITQLYGDSARFDFAPYRGAMDLVFVDGSHSYEYVLNDTRKALAVLAPGGTIIWDDCATEHPGVATALDRIGRRLPLCRIDKTRFALYTRRRR